MTAGLLPRRARTRFRGQKRRIFLHGEVECAGAGRSAVQSPAAAEGAFAQRYPPRHPVARGRVRDLASAGSIRRRLGMDESLFDAQSLPGAGVFRKRDTRSQCFPGRGRPYWRRGRRLARGGGGMRPSRQAALPRSIMRGRVAGAPGLRREGRPRRGKARIGPGGGLQLGDVRVRHVPRGDGPSDGKALDVHGVVHAAEELAGGVAHGEGFFDRLWVGSARRARPRRCFARPRPTGGEGFRSARSGEARPEVWRTLIRVNLFLT